MAGDIFYSEVDKNLRAELNARALAGAVIKDNAALDFNLTKLTNVQLTAFNSPKMTDNTTARGLKNDKEASPFAILGGAEVRTGNYIPTTNPVLDGDGSITRFDGGYLSSKRQAFRIPPVITLCDINIGDGSMGLLNKASINILISDPTADLDEFEHVWFRPGRHVLIEFEGNKEQIVTRNRNLSKVIQQGIQGLGVFDNIDEKIKEIKETYGLLEDPNTRTFEIFKTKYSSEFLDARLEQIRNMNKVLFDGVLTSFTFSYQSDGTVDVNLQFSGTSNVYTDVELMLPSNKKDDKGEKNPKAKNAEVNTFFKFISNTVNSEIQDQIKDTDQAGSLFPQLFFNSKYGNQKNDDPLGDTAILVGKLYTEGTAGLVEQPEVLKKRQMQKNIKNQRRYIQLGLLIKMLNQEVLSELERIPVGEDGKPDPEAQPIIVNAKVICDTQICRSTRYANLVSADPNKILLYGSDTGLAGSAYSRYPAEKHIIIATDEEVKEAQEAIKNGDKTAKVPEDSKPYRPEQLMPEVELKELNNNISDGKLIFPSRICIEVDNVIKPILENPEVKTANQFLKEISSVISFCAGGAISMTLVTDPAVADQLIYYDRNFIGEPDSVKAMNATPFKIPMGAKSTLDGANTLSGTIVKDLKLSSKLPADLQSLAFTLNQGTTVSSTAISAFTSFMYAQGNIDEEGSQKFKIAQSYKKSHEKAVRELKDAKCLLQDDWTSYTNQLRLSRALKEFLKYPTPSILDTNVLTAPIYPFDAELTIDGISGFKYGDVVELPILPNRYKTQTVFSIIGIDQTVDSAGAWSTKLKLIMRPKIE